MKFDGILAIDCWWNLPDIVIDNIKKIQADRKFLVNTENQDNNEKFKDWQICNDPNAFFEILNNHKREHKQVQKWLIVGQGWMCGTHNEVLGIDRLKKFVPGLVKLYTHKDLLALGTQHLDRTCTDADIKQDGNNWKKVDGGFYELS